MLDKNYIIRSFKEAKDRPKQIRILAELNNCKPAAIQAILIEAGYTKKDVICRNMNKQPDKPAKPANMKDVIATMRKEMEALRARESEIPNRIQALKQEYEAIAGKRSAIETAITALTDAFLGGGRRWIAVRC